MEVTDRIASLEQRVQMQEDDIQLLKSALADVVRRLNITEEQQAVLNRKGPTKGGHLRCAGAAGHPLALQVFALAEAPHPAPPHPDRDGRLRTSGSCSQPCPNRHTRQAFGA